MAGYTLTVAGDISHGQGRKRLKEPPQKPPQEPSQEPSQEPHPSISTSTSKSNRRVTFPRTGNSTPLPQSVSMGYICTHPFPCLSPNPPHPVPHDMNPLTHISSYPAQTPHPASAQPPHTQTDRQLLHNHHTTHHPPICPIPNLLNYTCTTLNLPFALSAA